MSYSFNYVDITLIAIFIVSTIIGYKRGLLVTIVNIVRYIFGFSICFYCGNTLAEPFYNKFLEQRAIEYISTRIDANTNVDDLVYAINDFKSAVPSFLNDFISFNSIKIPNNVDISNVILENIAQPLLISLSKGIIFIVVFLLFFVSTGIIIRLIQKSSRKKDKRDKKEHKPKSSAKIINNILGACFGVIKAVVLVMAVASILLYCQQLFDSHAEFYNVLTQSRVLSALNNNNLFGFLMEVKI